MCVDVFINNPLHTHFGSKKAKGNFLVHKRLQLKKKCCQPIFHFYGK